MNLPDQTNPNPWPTRSLAVLFLALALERLTNTTPDADLWGYLAFGRLFWESGRFPYQDVFAYLPTLHPWVYHEWLTGVLLYPLYQALGAPGLQLLKYSLALLALGLIYLTARGRAAEALVAVLALFLVQPFLGLGYSPVRAQAFTYALFPLTLYVAPYPADQQIIRPLGNPIKKDSHLVILYGNLAPTGAVAKITGHEGLHFEGTARCFHGEEAAMQAIMDGRIQKGDVVVVPAGVSHWFQAVEPPLLYYVVKVTAPEEAGR